MANEILDLAKQFNAQPMCCNDDGDYNRLDCALCDADIIGMGKENFLSFVETIVQNTVSQLEKDNKWQTMETAPRDGTNILGFSKIGFVHVVSYDADFKAPWRVINEFGFVEDVFTLWKNCPADPDLTGH